MNNLAEKGHFNAVYEVISKFVRLYSFFSGRPFQVLTNSYRLHFYIRHNSNLAIYIYSEKGRYEIMGIATRSLFIEKLRIIEPGYYMFRLL